MRTIRHLAGAAAGAIGLFVLGVPQAHAITIKEATLSGGMVSVSGSQAAKSAVISWEGLAVTTSTRGGAFTFTTVIIPQDCAGTLSDGTSTIEVPIRGCPGQRPLSRPPGRRSRTRLATTATSRRERR
jgi:hypothetical protein